MSEHHYKFNITMTCGGCSGAVERVLKRLDGASYHLLPCRIQPLHILPDATSSHVLWIHFISYNIANADAFACDVGVKSYDVKLDTQTADVVTGESLDYETVLGTIKKTGKAINSGEADGETKGVEI